MAEDISAPLVYLDRGHRRHVAAYRAQRPDLVIMNRVPVAHVFLSVRKAQPMLAEE
jgi:hypothetical protein